MAVDKTLKEIMQLCADVQDGLFEAASHSRRAELALSFQSAAEQWNHFADGIFPILLQLDHTSPEAKWKADPQRRWMNPDRNLKGLDDLAVCEECMQGLELAKSKLQPASAVPVPQVRQLVADQLNAIEEQRAQIVRALEDADRPAI